MYVFARNPRSSIKEKKKKHSGKHHQVIQPSDLSMCATNIATQLHVNMLQLLQLMIMQDWNAICNLCISTNILYSALWLHLTGHSFIYSEVEGNCVHNTIRQALKIITYTIYMADVLLLNIFSVILEQIHN